MHNQSNKLFFHYATLQLFLMFRRKKLLECSFYCCLTAVKTAIRYFNILQLVLLVSNEENLCAFIMKEQVKSSKVFIYL
jgi:hypothetical protein